MSIYKTQQGDTWDLISYRLYGSEFYTDQLFKANTQYEDVAIFAANVAINIPIIEQITVINVPPWERVPTIEQQQESISFNFDFVYKPGFSYRLIDLWVKQMNDVMYNKSK